MAICYTCQHRALRRAIHLRDLRSARRLDFEDLLVGVDLALTSRVPMSSGASPQPVELCGGAGRALGGGSDWDPP